MIIFILEKKNLKTKVKGLIIEVYVHDLHIYKIKF